MFPSWNVISCTMTNRIVIYCPNNPEPGSVRPTQAIRAEPTGARDGKIRLDVDDLPRAWYNIRPDLPAPPPPYLHPGPQDPPPPQPLAPRVPADTDRPAAATAAAILAPRLPRGQGRAPAAPRSRCSAGAAAARSGARRGSMDRRAARRRPG